MARRNLGFYMWRLLVNSNGPGHHRSHFVSKTTQPLIQPRSLPKISSHTLHSLHHLLPTRTSTKFSFWCTRHLKDYVPEDIGSISGFDPPQSLDSSYNNLQLGFEDFEKEPPLVPPHLHITLLNASSSYMEMLRPLSRPQHVVLNHLYMQRGKSGPSVVALGTT